MFCSRMNLIALGGDDDTLRLGYLKDWLAICWYGFLHTVRAWTGSVFSNHEKFRYVDFQLPGFSAIAILAREFWVLDVTPQEVTKVGKF